jgi:DNA repair protein RadC
MDKTDGKEQYRELPIEKMLLRGPEALSDAELVALILQTGTRECDVFRLSEKILAEASVYGNGILGLYKMPAEVLMRVHGIGRTKACKLKAVAEISKRIHETEACPGLRYESPQSIADYYMERLRHEQTEKVLLVLLDNRLHRISEHIISTGTVTSAALSPREIFITALERHAVHIVLLHNHPGGDVLPSRNDMEITERVRETGSIVGISLLDHIIIGDRKYMSFREKGFLDKAK